MLYATRATASVMAAALFGLGMGIAGSAFADGPPDPTGIAGLHPWRANGPVFRMDLAGGRSTTDMTTFRMYYPASYVVDRTPHYHLGTEHVIVLKGIVHLGLGSCLEPEKAIAYGPGSFMEIPAGTPHFEWFEGEVYIQVTSIGPMNAVQIADGCKSAGSSK